MPKFDFSEIETYENPRTNGPSYGRYMTLLSKIRFQQNIESLKK